MAQSSSSNTSFQAANTHLLQAGEVAGLQHACKQALLGRTYSLSLAGWPCVWHATS